MKKKILVTVLFIVLLILANPVQADNCDLKSSSGVSSTDNTFEIIFEVDNSINKTSTYILEVSCPGDSPVKITNINESNGTVKHTFTKTPITNPQMPYIHNNCVFTSGSHTVKLYDQSNPDRLICNQTYSVSQQENTCNISYDKAWYTFTDSINITTTSTGFTSIRVDGPNFNQKYTGQSTVNIPPNTLGQGWFTPSLWKSGPQGIGEQKWCDGKAFEVRASGPTAPPSSGDSSASDPCGGASGDAQKKCWECVGETATDPKRSANSWTALGCIPTDPGKFVGWLLPAAIGVAGGIAFLLMLWGVFTIIISSGNPERINQGKEFIVSALAGLLMILFSVFLLRLIGVDILGIPGLK